MKNIKSLKFTRPFRFGAELQTEKPAATPWWNYSVEQTSTRLSTHPEHGISDEEAVVRLGNIGPNRLEEKKPRSPFFLLLDQFRDFIIWVLIGAALVSGFLKEWVDSFAILGIVLLNAFLGFIQNHRAEQSLAALKKLSSPISRVIRGGLKKAIPSPDLVPGDLIELEAGDHIPADSRLVWTTSNFNVQEASLTGESTPVSKTISALPNPDVSLADRTDMVYTGTSVVSGKARALVAETGMRTELGNIAHLIQGIPKETTPLQKKLEQFGKWIVYLCFGLVGIVFLLEWIRGGKIIDVFLTAVSLAVAAIPEGLPAVVTIALALGVQRMARRHALIRKLPSVETLGCATVICSDKTGTLTRNEMTVQAVWAGGRLFRVSGIGYGPEGQFLENGNPASATDFPPLYQAILCAILCNGSRLAQHNQVWTVVGDPTEGALLTAGTKAGLRLEDEEKDHPFVDEIPFDSDRKKMTVIRRSGNRLVAYVKGAPDLLLENCTCIQTETGILPLTPALRSQIHAMNGTLTGEAMRVLALAFRVLDETDSVFSAETVEKDLVFCGLAAMIDPPRDEVKQAIAICRTAGIQPVMITGDHKNTAVAIARQLGFYTETSDALTGEELDRLSDAQFDERVEKIPVYARVSPEHKLRIVQTLKAHGHVVAMTGDGVNDAPAVKEADIGVAMGITGTDVTKEVSDMIVTDDNFASIVFAVEEGRGIYDNIKKFIHYLLSCNAGEIFVMFFASLIGLPIPLLPIHILWINLITDGLPALALGVDPIDPRVMEQPPRSPREGIMNRQIASTILLQGGFIAFCTLLAFSVVHFGEHEPLEQARTSAFMVLALSQLFHSFNLRNRTESIFRIGWLTNTKLVFAVLGSFLLQMAVVYLPFMQKVFRTRPLSLIDLVLVIAVSSFPLWAMELVKAINRRRNRKGDEPIYSSPD